MLINCINENVLLMCNQNKSGNKLGDEADIKDINAMQGPQFSLFLFIIIVQLVLTFIFNYDLF